MTKPKMTQSEPLTCSSLYPLYKVEGHGAHWRPVMEDACFVFPKGGHFPNRSPEAVIITRYVFPEQQYKREAERYIEIIHMLRQLPGGCEICDDIFEKIPITSKKTVSINQGGNT